MSRSTMAHMSRGQLRVAQPGRVSPGSASASAGRGVTSRARLEAPTLRQRPVTRHPSYLTLVSSPGAPPPPRRSGSGRRRARPRRADRGATGHHAQGRATLTSRGRGVLVAAIALGVALGVSTVLALMAGVVGPSAGASPGSADKATFVTIVVEPGDTLWGIAREVRPDDSTWETVHEIREANHLTDSAIRPGQRLVVPTSGEQ